MTKFIVLTKESDSADTSLWREAGEEEAHTAKSACEKRYLKNPSAEIKSIVAVPLRSWRPTSIRSEPQPPKVHLGEPVVEKQEQNG